FFAYYVAKSYKAEQEVQIKDDYYKSLSTSISNELKTLIREKKNTTRSIAVLVANNKKLLSILKNGSDDALYLKDMSKKLRDETDFKNVWFQLIDANGVSISRSWTDDNGDNINKIRSDIESMLNRSTLKTTISVGRYDLSFKSMVPIYDEQKIFLGFIEVITHFNSIAQKIKKLGYKPIVVVNEKMSSKLTNPFTEIFINKNYVANKNASKLLIDEILKDGLKSYISNKSRYIIKNDRLVVNYTILNENSEVIANFLIFKELKLSDIGEIEDMKFRVNLFLIITIILLNVIFYIISMKYSDVLTNINIKLLTIFFIFFAIVYAVYITLLYTYYHSQKESYIELHNQNFLNEFKIVNRQYSSIAKTIFKTTIEKKSVIELLVLAKDRDKRDEARQKLHKLLKADYELFKTLGVRQLHFHLSNNVSFLRFHRPMKFGDNLASVRKTVEFVNLNNRYIEGFEEGKIFNGFRYVFPMVNISDSLTVERVGSVEVSFSAIVFAENFSISNNIKSAFLVKSDIISSNVFENEQENYFESLIDGYSIEKAISIKLKNLFLDVDFSLIDSKQYEKIIKKIEYGKVFSIQGSDRYSLYTFLPIKSAVSNEVVATFVIHSRNNMLVNFENIFYILSLSGFIFSLLVFMYIYKEIVRKRNFEAISIKTQHILDAQDSLIIVTDGITLLDANTKFLDFFSYNSLESFKEDYGCVCDKFLIDDRFFHTKKIGNKDNWVHKLSLLNSKDSIVSMLDANNTPHYFMVKLNRFNENYVVVFSDVSDSVHEKFELENRALKDKLTGAYNRDYYDLNIDNIINNTHKGKHLGVIFIDIDFFKKVNDTYGHNVGDTVLEKTAQLISNKIRDNDILIRWGGEEFIILVYINSKENLYEIAQNIRVFIENEKFDDVGTITCSFGATLHKKDEEILDTIKRADNALYEAKESGRNTVIIK
ncbi:MAG: diguanylate cyclase, partial [Campylobacterota bacterium]|nr:diguanylate cyclase [Campylobacterota bacterium]